MLKLAKPKIITLDHIKKLDRGMKDDLLDNNHVQKTKVKLDVNQTINNKNTFQDGDDIFWLA